MNVSLIYVETQIVDKFRRKLIVWMYAFSVCEQQHQRVTKMGRKLYSENFYFYKLRFTLNVNGIQPSRTK